MLHLAPICSLMAFPFHRSGRQQFRFRHRFGGSLGSIWSQVGRGQPRRFRAQAVVFLRFFFFVWRRLKAEFVGWTCCKDLFLLFYSKIVISEASQNETYDCDCDNLLVKRRKTQKANWSSNLSFVWFWMGIAYGFWDEVHVAMVKID